MSCLDRMYSPRLAMVLLVALLIAILAGSTISTADEPNDTAKGLLAEIRADMARRELDAAKKKLDEAARLTEPPEVVAEVERLQLLHNYLAQFWRAVLEGVKTLGDTDELVVGKTRTSVVDFNHDEIVLRVNGQNRTFTRDNVPGPVVLALAARHLKDGVGANDVIVGTFHVMDAKGNRQEASRLWKAAEKAGVDVAALLPELELGPPPVKLQMPELTPAAKALLKPERWAIRRLADGAAKRERLGSIGTTDESGRLQVVIGSDESKDVQLLFGRRLTGNFGCRLYLAELPPGCQFGLFATSGSDGAHLLKLPAGDAKVEVARQAGKLICRLNDQPAELASQGEASERIAGNIGLVLPSGCKCTIGSLELR